jgi:WD40 repeat protein
MSQPSPVPVEPLPNDRVPAEKLPSPGFLQLAGGLAVLNGILVIGTVLATVFALFTPNPVLGSSAILLTCGGLASIVVSLALYRLLREQSFGWAVLGLVFTVIGFLTPYVLAWLISERRLSPAWTAQTGPLGYAVAGVGLLIYGNLAQSHWALGGLVSGLLAASGAAAVAQFLAGWLVGVNSGVTWLATLAYLVLSIAWPFGLGRALFKLSVSNPAAPARGIDLPTVQSPASGPVAEVVLPTRRRRVWLVAIAGIGGLALLGALLLVVRPSSGRVLQGHQATVNYMVWSQDGQYLLSSSMNPADGTLRLWQVSNRREVWKLQGPTWNPVLVGYTDPVFSPDGYHVAAIGEVAAGSNKGAVRVFNLSDGQMAGVFEMGETGSIGDVAYSPDGQYVALAGADEPAGVDGIVWIMSAADGAAIRGIPQADDIRQVQWSPDGQFLAVAHHDALSLWRASDGVLLQTIRYEFGNPSPTYFADYFAWSPDGQTLAIGGRSIGLYRASDGIQLGTLSGDGSRLVQPAWRPQGDVLAAVAVDANQVMFWKAGNWAPLRPWTGQRSAWTIAWSPDGRTIAIADGKDIRLWNWDEAAK